MDYGDEAQDVIYEFDSDQLFKTPSAASSTVLGRSSNSWIEWKTSRVG